MLPDFPFLMLPTPKELDGISCHSQGNGHFRHK